MDTVFGPFTVAPSQISSLGVRFTPFVNELLRIEGSAAALEAGQLTTSYRDNIGDRGVDAGLRRAIGTKYIPAGDSVWQFKAGDLPPARCRAELRGKLKTGEPASHAILRAGGSYRLVLGADLNDTQVADRRAALEEEAAALGIDVQPGTFEVLNASDLAGWASEHPSLAVSPLLDGIGHVARPFISWSQSSRLGGEWIPSPTRIKLIKLVHEFITRSSAADLHIEAVSGTGKTRAVLEALRDQDFEPLVAYVPAADDLPPTLLGHLRAQARRTILVVDECDAKQHKGLAGQLPVGTPIKLITIGEPAGYTPAVSPVTVEPIEDDALWSILRTSVPGLGSQHARFVVDAAAGNIGLALLLANGVLRQPTGGTSDLITRDVIKTYVTQTLPDGERLLACCVLALFPHVGYSDEPRAELMLIGKAFGFSAIQVKAAAQELAAGNLLRRRGRYRTVTPHPLAIHLAAQAWDHFEDEITTRLLPALPDDMVGRLFQRAVDVGDSRPIQAAVRRLLAPGGIYERLDARSDAGGGMLLLHLAALAPTDICDRIESTFATMSDDDIATFANGRPTVARALQRLAWRPATFDRAATVLLRIAAATPDLDPEHDLVARNWTDLFGTMLPTTAAQPQHRVAHVRVAAKSPDPRWRWLAVFAAKRSLSHHETAMVSSEVQGGVLVERRGRPSPGDAVYHYREEMITILASLTQDADLRVSSSAETQLVHAIGFALSLSQVRDHLARSIAGLPSRTLIAVQTEITHLTTLFERTDTHSDIEGDSRRRNLKAFIAQLPELTTEQTLESLMHSKSWDFPDGDLRRRIVTAARSLPADARVERLFGGLDQLRSAAYEIGYALAELAPDDTSAVEKLQALANQGDEAALVGYLQALVEAGDSAAFDHYLDSNAANALTGSAALRVSVRGPYSDAGWARVSTAMEVLSPSKGARDLLGWHLRVTPETLHVLLTNWLPRINTQDDFNAVTEFTSHVVHRWPPKIGVADPLIDQLLGLRTQFGELAQHDWEWEQLCRRTLIVQPQKLLLILLDVVEKGAYYPDLHNDEDNLLRAAVIALGSDGWREVMDRLERQSHQAHLAAGRWLAAAVDVEVVRSWVDQSIDRARLVASVANPGTDNIEPVAEFLVDDFGTDAAVATNLRDALIPDLWIGSEAAQYQSIIDRITAWTTQKDLSADTRAWIRTTAEQLASLSASSSTKEEEDF